MELLVVIAIIGILSTVVLGQVNSARDKAESASVKAMMANMKVQAEIWYDTNGQKYTTTALTNTTCPTSGTTNIFQDPTIQKAIAKIITQTPAGGTRVCSISGDFWAFYVPSLKGEIAPAKGWCIDNSGAAKVLTTAVWAGSTTDGSTGICPAS